MYIAFKISLSTQRPETEYSDKINRVDSLSCAKVYGYNIMYKVLRLANRRVGLKYG